MKKMFEAIKKCFNYNTDENLMIANIFRPLYVVLSILGLFPYSIKFRKHGRDNIIIVHKSVYFNLLWAIIYITLIISFMVFHIRYVYHDIGDLGDSNMTREIMTQMNYILELAAFAVFIIIAYIGAFINRSRYVKIIKKISYFIEPTNMNIDNVLKSFRFEVKLVVSFLILTLILQICINFSRDSTAWKMTLVTITFLLPQMIQFSTLAFYYVLILMLLILLFTIRERISSLRNENNILMDCFVKVETKMLKLKHAEALYVKAFKLKSEINEAFQAPILVATLQCFHSIVSEAHIIYHGIVVESSLSVHSVVNCSFWIIYQFIKIYILARSGDLIKLEVLKIGQELHSIPTAKYDLRLLTEIQHFSSLMSYQSVEITAYGFFTLDAGLLSTIVTSATMYLIILVQFDKK